MCVCVYIYICMYTCMCIYICVYDVYILKNTNEWIDLCT